MAYMIDIDTTHRMWYHGDLQVKTSYAAEGATALKEFHTHTERATDKLLVSCRQGHLDHDR
ncbi:MAG TPA: hypothetical protein DCW74_05555 [Alteromonas australica]|uniref:Uncharacterized protein n=1 Tax=Alteromonas australica TaxID=589873 RepID=A0A350P1M0_9ALTE|nr:hypothetical protein [Alteromonas australica]